ncbi:MAG: hypothetical protein HQL52_18680, partial [Magnetococcales bacterium]|nr:hypothetical protein [Magnetococcales bacterium]
VRAVAKNMNAASVAASFLKSMKLVKSPKKASDPAWFIWQQQLSPALISLYEKRVTATLEEKFAASDLNDPVYSALESHFSLKGLNLQVKNAIPFGASDLPWRLDWIGHVPALYSCYAMEDYLLHTTPPNRIEFAVEQKARSSWMKTLSKEVTPCLSLDPEETRLGWECQYNRVSNLKELSQYSKIDSTNECLESADDYDSLKRALTPLQGVFMQPQDVLFKSYKEVLSRDGEQTQVNHRSTYLMDLLVLAPPARVKDAPLDHYLDKEWPGNYNQAMLGRYSRIVLQDYYDPTDGVKGARDPAMSIHTPADSTVGQTSKNRIFPYYARRRVLRRVLFPYENSRHFKQLPIVKNPAFNDATFVVLVGLWFAGMRSIFLNWLFSKVLSADIPSSIEPQTSFAKSLRGVFLSSGWEDLVILLKPEQVGNSLDIIAWLQDHPLVQKTNTHIAASFLPDDEVKAKSWRKSNMSCFFHMRLRRTTDEFKEEFKKCILQKNEYKEVQIYDVTGDMDFTLDASKVDPSFLKSLRRDLFQFKTVAHIQTQLRYAHNSVDKTCEIC